MRSRRPELAVALLRHGYGYSDGLRERIGVGGATEAPSLPVRLLGSPALLVAGPVGVEAFTDVSRVRRHGATPGVVANVLFGHGAVHALDDEAHRVRKQLFVEVLDADGVARLVRSVCDGWEHLIERAVAGTTMSVEETSARVIGHAALDWAGIEVPTPVGDRVIRWWAEEVDGFGVVGPAYPRARRARRRSDAWARDRILDVRGLRSHPRDGSLLDRAARWRDERGAVLPLETAAVDLQNGMRPAVATSRFVAFAAHRLWEQPSWRDRVAAEIAAGASDLASARFGPVVTAVAREVRRVSPFVPLLAARSRRAQEILGHRVAENDPVLLDVVGTLRDPQTWPEPRRFDPGRFLSGGPAIGGADALIPQGGGSVVAGHRCPGEDPVLGILSAGVVATTMLGEAGVPRPRIDERRLPARPPAVELHVGTLMRSAS